MALWGGRFEKGVDAFTQEFGASLEVDKNMAQQDIRGSRAHARMLAEQGIISDDDQQAIDAGLEDISRQIADGSFVWDVNDEDVHMAVESKLTAAIGAPGARLHTGRPRNDQVATDIRLLAKDLCAQLMEGNLALRRTLVDVAENYLGLSVEQRPVRFDEIDQFTECGMCGTAAVISPVGEVDSDDKKIIYGMEEVGPVMKKLRETLTGIQSGEIEDKFGWVHEIA